MTEEARTEYMIGEKYGALSENAQTVIAEAFDELDSRAEEEALGVANYDLNGELPDVDEIVGDEDEEAIDAAGLGEDDYAAIFEEAGWEAEQS
jgi:hypothetical protein